MIINRILLSTVTAMAGLTFVTPVIAGVSDYIGEVTPAGFTFCPRQTAEMNGQLLSINSNQALFSLLGTTYGGDGRTTFALPDLRSRVPVHTGQGPGLSSRPLGSRGGSEDNFMTQAQMPRHSHSVGIRTVNKAADSTDPRGNAFTVLPNNAYSTVTPTARFMNANSVLVQDAGSGQSQNNMQPYLTIRYCIVTQGVFPSRN